MIVCKFGGTSVADSDAQRRLAGIVAPRVPAGALVVVSALAGVSDSLIAILDDAARGRGDRVRREGAVKGGYVLIKEKGALKTILLATGSELQHAVDAAKQLGDGVRVVSMPCFERFERQSESYRNEVLPPSCTNRIAIEAGVTGLWWKYVGLSGKVLGIDRFGMSAPGNVVMKELGMTADAVVKAAK